MTLIADPGQVSSDEVVKTETLETRFFNGREYRLVHVSAGWEPAGSMMRWTDGYYSTRCTIGGAIHGQQTKTEDEARALLDRWETRYNEDQATLCALCSHPMSEHNRYACPE